MYFWRLGKVNGTSLPGQGLVHHTPFLNVRKWPRETSVPSSVTKPSTDDGTEVNSDDDLKPGSSIWNFDEQPKDGVSLDCSLTESKQDEANVAGNTTQVVVQDSALMVLSSRKARTGDTNSNSAVESVSSTISYGPDSVNPWYTRVDSSSSWCAAEPKMQVPVRNQRERLRHSQGDLSGWRRSQYLIVNLNCMKVPEVLLAS